MGAACSWVQPALVSSAMGRYQSQQTAPNLNSREQLVRACLEGVGGPRLGLRLARWLGSQGGSQPAAAAGQAVLLGLLSRGLSTQQGLERLHNLLGCGALAGVAVPARLDERHHCEGRGQVAIAAVNAGSTAHQHCY